MKRILILSLALIAALTLLAQPKREHRAVWETASLGDWPGVVTSVNVDIVKASCGRMLDSLEANNMNAIYFHVRTYCDALYKSAYEPWSSYVSTARGVEPPLDPLAWLLQEAHKRGIEVYAWVNPYRYGHGSNKWGACANDYVNTHPDWLMTTDYETVLNPGIPEVRQRVIDVCKDIVTHYDIDGLVFDDYFYNQGGSSFNLDSVQYNAYKRRGGTLAQADWRRANVNSMVAGVDSMVLATKPWVHFGIGPAGSAGADAAQWGVDPTPAGDWQYNQIYSDPLQWIATGTIDFMAPQIYWNIAGTYDELTAWWGKVGRQFNRHIYVSQDVSKTGNSGWDLGEYLQQVQVMRADGLQGMSYFDYGHWRNNNTKYQDTTRAFRLFMKQRAYSTKSLTPAITWRQPAGQYGGVTNLKRADATLTWDAVPGVRYAIYAFPAGLPLADFKCQATYLQGVRYDAAYAIPNKLQSGYLFAVTILDRYGNEYAPVLCGSTPTQAVKPVILAPGNGATVSPLALLKWQSPGATSFNVQVYSDQAMTHLVANVAVDSASLPIAAVPGVTQGTYWWRVVARGLNLTDAVSDPASFTLGGIQVTSPAAGATGVSLTPTITWDKAADDSGVSYLVEISEQSSMASPEFTATTTATTLTVPRYALAGAMPYYVRVTASRGQVTTATPVQRFTTAEVIPGTPTLITPSADGVTLYGSQHLQATAADGVESLRIEISKTKTFPSRGSLKLTLPQGAFATAALKDLTGTNRPTDGKDYYVRARYAYRTLATGSTVQFSAYSPVLLFHYVEALPGDINADGLVNVDDVTELVNQILGTTTKTATSDIDGNGLLNVNDVTDLVNLILGN